LIGNAAKNQAATNPENTVFGKFYSIYSFIHLIIEKGKKKLFGL